MTIHAAYVITNLVNGKVYVGQSKNPAQRKKGHWAGGRHGGKGHLYDAMRKYGLDKFKFDILEECSEDLIDDRERHWIAQYSSTDPSKGYNKESGGHALKALHEETKRKISESLKGVPFTEERCKNISDAQRGVPCLKNRRENNPERGKRISESLKGTSISKDHKCAVSASLSSYFASHEVKHSEESRRHMSEAQKIIGKRRTEKATIDVDHPDAQSKECPVCHKTYGPKKLILSMVKRHAVKRWCSRSCGRVAQNTSLSPETRCKIANRRRGSRLSKEQRQKISESMKNYKLSLKGNQS